MNNSLNDINLNLPLDQQDYTKENKEQKEIRRKANNMIIDALLFDDRLSDWDKNFINNIEGCLLIERYKFSSRQEAQIDRILENLNK